MSEIKHPSQEACEEAARRANEMEGLYCDGNYWEADMVNRFYDGRPNFPALRAMAFLIDEVKYEGAVQQFIKASQEMPKPIFADIPAPSANSFKDLCAIEAMKIMLANAAGNYGEAWLLNIAEDATQLAALMVERRDRKPGGAE